MSDTLLLFPSLDELLFAGSGGVVFPSTRTVLLAAAEEGLLVDLERIHPGSLTLLAIALSIVGGIVAGLRPDPRQWGLKCGVGVFIGWILLWLLENGMDDPNSLFAALYRGFLFALITTGSVRTIHPAWKAWDESNDRWQQEQARRKEEKRRQKQAKRDAAELAERNRLAEIEYQRNAPERERLAREAETRRRLAAEEQERRKEARAQALQAFNRVREVVGKRFTREDFDEYVRDYLSDEHSARTVERRLQELRDLLQHHADQIDPPPKQISLAESAEWFQRESEKISALDIDERLKRTMLAKLKGVYVEQMDRLMEDLSP